MNSTRLLFCSATLVMLAGGQPLSGPSPRTAAPPRDVAFIAAADQTRQYYVELLPDRFDRAQQHDVLIALHGHGSDRWQYIRDPRDECRAVRAFAQKHAMILISPDYRAATSWMGPRAESDVVQIIGLVRRQYRVARVFLAGGSMGGSSALTFAALHPDLVAGVSSQNGTANHLEFDHFQDAIAASFGGAKQHLPGEYKKRSAEYWPELLTMPVSLTVGEQDTLVPPHSVTRLAVVLKKLGRPVLLISRPDQGHQTNEADTLAALEYLLQPAPGSHPATSPSAPNLESKADQPPGRALQAPEPETPHRRTQSP